MNSKNWRPNYAVAYLMGDEWYYFDSSHVGYEQMNGLEMQLQAYEVFRSYPSVSIVIRAWPTQESYEFEVLRHERNGRVEQIASISTSFDTVAKKMIWAMLRNKGYAPKLPVDESAMEPVSI